MYRVLLFLKWKPEAAAQSALKDNCLENFRKFLKNIQVWAYFSIAECSKSEAPVKLNPVEKLFVKNSSEKFCFSEQLKEHLWTATSILESFQIFQNNFSAERYWPIVFVKIYSNAGKGEITRNI